jgi:hypothetical protein
VIGDKLLMSLKGGGDEVLGRVLGKGADRGLAEEGDKSRREGW